VRIIELLNHISFLTWTLRGRGQPGHRPSLPPELTYDIIGWTWRNPNVSHSVVFRTLSLVCRTWGTALRPFVWEDVFCVRDSDFCLYLRLALEDTSRNGSTAVHIRTKAMYMGNIWDMHHEQFGATRTNHIRALLRRLADAQRGRWTYLFPDANILTIVDARDLADNRAHAISSSPYEWIARSQQMTELRLFEYNGSPDRNEEWLDRHAHALQKLCNPRVKTLVVATQASQPCSTCPSLVHLYPGLRTLELRIPTPLTRLASSIPPNITTLVLKCVPLAQLNGRSSVLEWLIRRALREGLLAPNDSGEGAQAHKRIVIRTGRGEPLGWETTKKAAEEHGIELIREIAYGL
jgi:hypothetical protein